MLQIGQNATLSRRITDTDVQMFAQLLGDSNPVHLDEAYAEKTRFGRPIVHGMLVASLISTVLGTMLPGPGTIYLSQTLRFLTPMYLGDTVTVEVTVTGMREDKPIFTLATTCRNHGGVLVIQGEAVVLLDEVA